MDYSRLKLIVYFPVQSLDFDVAAKNCGGVGNFLLGVHVGTSPFKAGLFLHLYLNYQVARRPLINLVAFALQPQVYSVVHTLWNFYCLSLTSNAAALAFTT